MQIPSREHESRTIPARFTALFAAIALALCCTLPLTACESGSFSDSQAANPAAVQIADIPEYSGALCIDVNNSEPGFTDDDFKRGAFMEFSDLDFEGRCGAAFARIGTDTLSNAPRGDISQAERLLNAVSDHNAEWSFLMGNVCYRRGWLDEAKRYFETACRMDPENPEYRQALAAFNNRGYRPQGYQTVSTSCGNDVCSNWCLAALCCNLLGGGGYFCLPCMF